MVAKQLEMSEQELANITVLIAGRPYPLKIKKGNEPAIRKIVKEVNEKINRFQLTYTKKDKQDCISMALLTYAVDLHKTRENGQALQQPELSDKLHQIDELLDELLLK